MLMSASIHLESDTYYGKGSYSSVENAVGVFETMSTGHYIIRLDNIVAVSLFHIPF